MSDTRRPMRSTNAPRSSTARPVVVVGGGPAGCAAAAALVRGGRAVVLLEAGAPGRAKACGDAFDREALARLGALGVGRDAWVACGGKPVSHINIRSTAAHGPEARIDVEGTWHIPRAAIDQCLRDALAPRVDLRYRHRVCAARPEGEGWSLRVEAPGGELTLDASAVVLAHGAKGRLSRDLGIDGDPDIATAVRGYIDAPGLDAELVEVSLQARPGYAWAFPLAGSRANVGFGIFAGARASVRAHADALLARHGWRMEGPWLGSPLAVWSGRGERWHDPRGVVSCGDAGGLVEPLTGGGIAHALRSGEAAGNAIAGFLTAGRDPTALALHSAVTRAFFARRFDTSPGASPWVDFIARVDRFASVG